MSKLLHKICFLCMLVLLPLPLFTQCEVSNHIIDPEPTPVPEPDTIPEPEPEPDTIPEPELDTVLIVETRRMDYEDYRILRDNSYYAVYKSEPKEVTTSRCGKEFSIKGIFKKYPDAWIKGRVMPETHTDPGDTYVTRNVYFENGQIIAHENGKPVYFHCGKADYSSIHDSKSVTMRFTFKPEDGIRIFRFGDNPDYFGTFHDESSNYNAFWYDNDPDGETVYYSTWQDRTVKGTGFPDFDCVVNFKIENQRKGRTGNGPEVR